MLIVDDDPSVRLALESVMRAEGYLTSVAGDGEAALVEFARVRPTLVLLDVGLPQLSGIAVCHRMRLLDTDVSIIMVTAIYGPEWKLAAMNAGADDYITKPFGLDDLLDRIHRVEERRVAP